MSQSIGQRLKQERETRFLTLEKASEVTRIRIVFLQALEADDYSVMPSAAQGRGFLRNYAEYLDLNIDEMIAGIQRNAPSEISGPLPTVNLVETEIPPLTDAQEEKPALSFLSSSFARRPKSETLPETASAESLQDKTLAPAVVVDAEQIKPRGRRKKKGIEEAPLPDTAEPSSQKEMTEEKAEASILPIEIGQGEVNAEREVQ
ncbi:MAG TPA: helix-turn-helix transcriptional regulator, partial [Anaerolineales bacterium]|nr:helix-turn-helix transcriptional regulator [Anaerolineales bacterium]